MSELKPYNRVSCDFYDKLVNLTKDPSRIRIRYLNEFDKKCLIEAAIVELKMMDSAEWIVIDDGSKIRMDRILDADDVIVRYDME